MTESGIFKGKIVIVTGAASGIGCEISRQLVEQGAEVIMTDKNQAGVEVSAKAFSEASNIAGGKAFARLLDVTQAEAVQQLVDQTVSEHGRLDYIFNNAGFAVGGELRDVTLEHWNRIIDVNLKGVVHGVTAAYPVMLKQGSGHIINTASLAGLLPSPTLTPYSTTKHAVVGLSLSLRAEAEALGVKVTAFCPGFIDTSIFDNAVYADQTDAVKARSLIPFKLVPVDKAVGQLLDGVAKNKAIVTLPTYAKISLLLKRFAPVLITLSNRKMIHDSRKLLGK